MRSMSTIRILGITLLAAGVLALALRGFSTTKERHAVEIGPIDVQMEERERVAIPTWLGAALVGAGGALILVSFRR